MSRRQQRPAPSPQRIPVIFVLPILVALVAYWRTGGFAPEAGLLNGDEPAAPYVLPEAEPADVRVVSYSPLSGRLRLIAVAIFAAGLGSTLIPAAHFGESPQYKLTAEQARASADAFLRAQDIDPGSYLHVTYPEVHWGGDDSLAAKYFLEHRTLNAASRLFELYRPVQHWATRYFKSLEKEEFLATVNPETGHVMGFDRQLPEDRPGADLTPDAARSIAADFAMAHGLAVAAMDLKESQSEKRKARRDYSLVWEARPGDPRNVDEARYRVAIGVDGDRVLFHAFVLENSRKLRAQPRSAEFHFHHGADGQDGDTRCRNGLRFVDPGSPDPPGTGAVAPHVAPGSATHIDDGDCSGTFPASHVVPG